MFAALAQATPIEYGHYAAPALVHAPIYHSPIAKHVVHAEPIVNLKTNCLCNFVLRKQILNSNS